MHVPQVGGRHHWLFDVYQEDLCTVIEFSTECDPLPEPFKHATHTLLRRARAYPSGRLRTRVTLCFNDTLKPHFDVRVLRSCRVPDLCSRAWGGGGVGGSDAPFVARYQLAGPIMWGSHCWGHLQQMNVCSPTSVQLSVCNKK
jgi:hypothetical protein